MAKKSIVSFDGDVARIYLGGSHKEKFALVDRADAELIGLVCWYHHTGGYASRCVTVNGKSVSTMMHRVIAGAGIREQVDHINGDRLDNRRCNLQICSQSINVIKAKKHSGPHTSKYRGVCRKTGSDLWDARIMIGGHYYRIGLFRDERVAGLAVDSVRQTYLKQGVLPNRKNMVRNKRQRRTLANR